MNTWTAECASPLPPPDGRRELLCFVLLTVATGLMGCAFLAAIHYATRIN